MGRPRNETPTRKTLAKDAAAQAAESTFKESDYPHRNEGAHLATLPMGKREFWRLIFGTEAAPGCSTMTQEERATVTDKIMAGFSDAERAALEAYQEAGKA
jgi:hypothetical protein